MTNWICDFDGTLTNVDMGREFAHWMFSTQRVSLRARLVRILGAPLNFALRRANQGQKILAWSYGLSSVERKKLFNEFLEEFDTKISLNVGVIRLIEESNSETKILLTGCYEELAKLFLFRRGIESFHEVIGLRMKNSFLIRSHPYAQSKAKLAKNYSPYIGAGDSWQDRFFLKNASCVYVVGSDTKLISLAQQMNWNMI